MIHVTQILFEMKSHKRINTFSNDFHICDSGNISKKNQIKLNQTKEE